MIEAGAELAGLGRHYNACWMPDASILLAHPTPAAHPRPDAAGRCPRSTHLRGSLMCSHSPQPARHQMPKLHAAGGVPSLPDAEVVAEFHSRNEEDLLPMMGGSSSCTLAGSCA